jgi:16S rRNA (guanine527-N7)-methyltransferase
MPAVSEAVLRESCEHLGLEVTTTKIDKLLKIKEFLTFYGRSMNLTASAEGLDEHLVEGLQVVALARRLGVGGRWLDVGSGGGFPGLVLAAWLDLPFVFVEPRAKRASALELALAQIGRPDVRVLRGRLERGKWQPLAGEWLEPGFDAASARAVFAPEKWLEEARPWVKPGGVVCLHLGAEEEAPQGCDVVGRVDGARWGAVGVRNVPRGTG